MNYGTVTRYQTGEEIRPATLEELRRSLAAGAEGTYQDPKTGVTVFVDGEDEAARKEAEED